MLPSRLIMAAALVVLSSLGVLSSNAMAMSIKFSLSGYQACSPRSPAFVVSDVPADTARLAFHMIDQNALDYPHGGGTVAYGRKGVIPAGAFAYKGPCPPSGQQHIYEWAVQALDRSGKALGSATASAPFPPR